MKIFSNDYQTNLPTNKFVSGGGTARFANVFAEILTKNGHEWVGLIFETKVENKIGSHLTTCLDYKKWWKLNIPRGYISKNFSLAKKYKDPYNTSKELIEEVKNILNKEKPDLVFINGTYSLPWILLRAAHDLNIPIITLHAGVWHVELDIYSDFFSSAGLKICKKIEKDFAILSDCNIFLNKAVRDYFRKNVHQIPITKTRIIPLPCESSRIRTKPKTKSMEKVNVGIVARWDRIKNHKAFLDIAKIAATLEKKWNFFAVTNIPETNTHREFKEDYKKFIKVVAPMEQKELKTFYRKMDFMILPSFFDVSPHVVLEAAFEGVPTYISKNVGYASLFKENGLKNYIVDFSNPKKAFAKIESMKFKKYPSNFVKHLKEEHDPGEIYTKFEILFKKTIK